MKRHMTMKEFLKEFYPSLTQRQFAKLMNGSESIISKMKTKQNYDLNCGSAKVITNWILQHHNVVIIYDSPQFKMEKDFQKKFDAIIKQKDEKIAELEAIIKDLKKNFIDKKGLKTLANKIKWDYFPWKWIVGLKNPYNIYTVVNRFSKKKPPIVPVSLWDAVYWEDEYYYHPEKFLKEVRK